MNITMTEDHGDNKMAEAITYQRYDANDVQILRGKTVVAHALRMAGGGWKLFDTEGGVMMSRELFVTSAEAVRAFDLNAKPAPHLGDTP